MRELPVVQQGSEHDQNGRCHRRNRIGPKGAEEPLSNPQESGSEPRMQTYEIEEADGMTLFIALNEIREKQDPSLQFDFVCRAGICGSCGMIINGPASGCAT
jgi:hypothetical protein